MALDYKDMIHKILDSLSEIDYIKPEDIPSIPLYVDQITSFMESQLQSARRHPDDKIMTKTMINNYTKNNLIPPPEKKKYSKEHVLLLIFIYYLKNILSIGDIQTLLTPITEKYFLNQDNLSLTDVYDEVFSLEQDQMDRLVKEVVRSYQIADTTFSDVPENEREFLNQFAFIGMLAFDVYIKKQIIEKMIDQIGENTKIDEPSKKDKKKQ